MNSSSLTNQSQNEAPTGISHRGLVFLMFGVVRKVFSTQTSLSFPEDAWDGITKWSGMKCGSNRNLSLTKAMQGLNHKERLTAGYRKEQLRKGFGKNQPPEKALAHACDRESTQTPSCIFLKFVLFSKLLSWANHCNRESLQLKIFDCDS